jgi:hypothetical protein
VVPFERRVVDCLTRTDDPALRAAVADYVEASLGAMPEHLRAGVLVESLALGAWVRVVSRGRRDDDGLRRRLAAWEHHPVDVVRQYVRLVGSLVLFAEVELGDRAAAVAAV